MLKTAGRCWAALTAMCALGLSLSLPAAAWADSPQRASRPEAERSRLAPTSLADALESLQKRGLKIVFTTNVVRPSMRASSQLPGETEDLRSILDALLAPHGLEARDAPNQTLVVVPKSTERAAQEASGSSVVGVVRSRYDTRPVPGVAITAVEAGVAVTSGPNGSFRLDGLPDGPLTLEVRRRGFVVETIEHVVAEQRAAQLDILLDPAPVSEEVVRVTPSRISLLRHEPAAPVALSRDKILALPHLGDDFFRALSLLPGIAANDASAQFNIRGGRRNETLIVLDGQELYETFHLKDFDSAQSIIASTTLESVDLSTGSFSAEHGDRMGGVLDMKTRSPSGPTRTRLGISILGAEAGAAGTFKSQRGSWIAQARRGSNDFAGKLIGPERPVFWDGFSKIDFQLSPENLIRGNFLHSEDSFDFVEVQEEDNKSLATEYSSSYLWLTQQTIVGPDLFFETALSSTRVKRDRNGLENAEDVQWLISDRRNLKVSALRQSWNLQATPVHYLRAGFEFRDFESAFDYDGAFEFEDPLAQIRTNSELDGITFRDTFDESHQSVYVTDRLELPNSTSLEVGLRYDQHSQTDESHVAPRLNLAHTVGDGSVIRLAWGRFNQSQRPYELAVEDSDTTFRKVERSEHRLIGLEHRFQKAAKAGLTLRLEAYQREITNPQPRWGNLYEQLNEFQEVEPDRIRITPDRAYAEGIELFLQGRAGSRAEWFVNYALASTDDEIDGRRQPRSLDQTHGLNLDFDYRPNDNWTLNVAWRFHTGWPTTPLGLEPSSLPAPASGGTQEENDDPDGEEDPESDVAFVPVLGAPFSARLPDYHRLDLRASRRWQLESGLLTLFMDIQNVYDRSNQAGFDYEVDDVEGTVTPNPEFWQGFFPSLGLRWEF